MKILDTAHHRNGVGGTPATLVTFTEWEEGDRSATIYLAIIPDTEHDRWLLRPETDIAVRHNIDCFVVRIDLLPDIRFGVNSERGDRALRALLAAGLWEDDQFLIQHEDSTEADELFWSNTDGWVAYGEANVFSRTAAQRHQLPIQGHWVALELL